MTTIEVMEPATGRVLQAVDETTTDELDGRIEEAAAAQGRWAAAPPQQRAETLASIAAAIEHEAEHLAQLEARNVGMPINDARGAITGVGATFRYYSAGPERLLGHTIPVAGGVDMTFREPIGVVGAITPWNFPLSIAAWKIAPALAAGNAIVLKPAELTPLTALELERIATEAGLPPGLLSVVNGTGPTVGRALVDHPHVRKISFTGSTAVGSDIAQRAGRRLKRVSLELGGKSAAVIFADSDLDAAAAGLVGGVFGNSGQDCCARSRVYVERPAMDAFLQRLEQVVTRITVGDPLDEASQMGPLISERQAQRVHDYVAHAPVLFRGSAPTGKGFWFPPTVLHPIDDTHRAAREEIFGPVVAVMPFDTEPEVLARVNATEYGLAGSIWTGNGARALRIARGMEAGALAVNSYSSVRITTPFGGVKHSGLGRELGPHALHAYTEEKNVFFSTSD